MDQQQHSEATLQGFYPDDPADVLLRRPGPSPEQLLAAAVLRQALADAIEGRRWATAADRLQARAFLSGGPALEFWCAVLGVPVQTVQGLARRALAAGTWRPPHLPNPPRPDSLLGAPGVSGEAA